MFNWCAAVKTFAAAAAFISALLFSIVAGTLLIGFGTANFITPVITISVTSPENNKVYAVNSVSLKFTVITNTYGIAYSIGKPLIQYYLDGKLKGQFESFESKPTDNDLTETFSVTLTGLSEGLHWVKVTKTVYWDVWIVGNYTEISSSGNIHFFVDTPPRISILAPQDDQTYDATDIPLNFTVNEPVSWMGYSLDGKANVTIIGNANLTGLSDGSHSLTVYANDTVGKTGASETIYFSIKTQQSQPSPTLQPTNPPVQQPAGFLGSNLPIEYGYGIVAVTVAAVIVSLLVYFKKRKR